MTWSTTNKTWAVGEIVTAAMMNQYIRDQLNQTSLGKITTTGDLVYASSATTLDRLAIGSTGQLLAVQGNGKPSWFTPPSCYLQGSTQAALSGTLTALNWTTELFDASSMHSTATNSSRITVNVPGTYQCAMQVGWDGDSSGNRHQLITNNSIAGYIGYAQFPASAVVNGIVQAVSAPVPVSSATYFVAYVYQDSTGTRQVQLGANVGMFAAHWIAP